MIDEKTGSGNGQLSDKIITACSNTLTHLHADKHSLGSEMSIVEHLWPFISAGAEDIGWKIKRLFEHKICN
jgi:hypothetical protein